MFSWGRHLQRRELGFLGVVAVTLAITALYLNAGLRLADRGGVGWRTVDLGALQRRIESGELRDREADWYHPATAEEATAGGLR